MSYFFYLYLQMLLLSYKNIQILVKYFFNDAEFIIKIIIYLVSHSCKWQRFERAKYICDKSALHIITVCVIENFYVVLFAFPNVSLRKIQPTVYPYLIHGHFT
jgi:hypothetical protein